MYQPLFQAPMFSLLLCRIVLLKKKVQSPRYATSEDEICYDVDFIVTGGTAGCRYDNLRYHQWR